MSYRPFVAFAIAASFTAGAATSAQAADWMDDRPANPPPRDEPTPEAKGPETMRLAADFALVLPVGDWSDFSGIGLGALLRFEARVADNVSITARLGYIGHLENDGFSTSEIPILFPGVKVHFGDVYLGLEAGLLSLGVAVDFDDEFGSFSGSDSEMKLGLTFGLGYVIDKVDLRLQLFAPSVEDFSDLLGIMFNVGYTFVTF
jgi:opacity protein-like surface antigen